MSREAAEQETRGRVTDCCKSVRRGRPIKKKKERKKHLECYNGMNKLQLVVWEHGVLFFCFFLFFLFVLLSFWTVSNACVKGILEITLM